MLNRRNQNSLIEFPFFYTIHQDNPPLQLTSQPDVLFLETLFRQSIAEAELSGEYKLEMLRSLLGLILTTCAARYQENEHLSQKGKGQILVKQFFHLLEENHTQNFPISRYAEMIGVTPNHLTQTVKTLTGKTSSQMIKAKQLLEIKRLLVHTNLTVSEIASQLNFDDPILFTKFSSGKPGLLHFNSGTKFYVDRLFTNFNICVTY